MSSAKPFDLLDRYREDIFFGQSTQFTTPANNVTPWDRDYNSIRKSQHSQTNTLRFLHHHTPEKY